MGTAAIGRFIGKGRVWSGLPCVSRNLGFGEIPDCALGALNWATGETVAIKEIQLSNIPKSEIGQIMVRRSRSILVIDHRHLLQSEIDLLQNLHVSLLLRP